MGARQPNRVRIGQRGLDGKPLGMTSLGATDIPRRPLYTLSALSHFPSLLHLHILYLPIHTIARVRPVWIKKPPSLPVPITPLTMTSLMTVATTPAPSPFNPMASRPRVSSPLAASAQANPVSSRNHSFPTSRPLRPFPSLAIKPSTPARKPVKILEPPANFKGAFVLNLTPAELSRRD
ncbi:hypothetical protein BD309DRAFT_991155 [Dichomitus squalens]|nr:hypothetical protein BD309DRAFT_991155 [Dichomitus squalens]